MNIEYVTRPVGFLKLLQLLFGVLAAICAGVWVQCLFPSTTNAPTTAPQSTTVSAISTTPPATITSSANTASSPTATSAGSTIAPPTAKLQPTGNTTNDNASQATPTTGTTGSSPRGKRAANDETSASTSSAASTTTVAMVQKWSFYTDIGADGIGFVLFACIVCIIGTVGLFVLYFFGLDESLFHSKHRLQQIEFIFTLAAIVLYIISFSIMAWYSSTWKGHICTQTAWQASATFCFFTLTLYGVGLFFFWRSSSS